MWLRSYWRISFVIFFSKFNLDSVLSWWFSNLALHQNHSMNSLKISIPRPYLLWFCNWKSVCFKTCIFFKYIDAMFGINYCSHHNKHVQFHTTFLKWKKQWENYCSSVLIIPIWHLSFLLSSWWRRIYFLFLPNNID